MADPLSGYDLLQHAYRHAQGSEEFRQGINAAIRQLLKERRVQGWDTATIALSGRNAPSVAAHIEAQRTAKQRAEQQRLNEAIQTAQSQLATIDKFDADLELALADGNMREYGAILQREFEWKNAEADRQQRSSEASAELHQRSDELIFQTIAAQLAAHQEQYPGMDLGGTTGDLLDDVQLSKAAAIVKVLQEATGVPKGSPAGVTPAIKQALLREALIKSGADSAEEFTALMGAASHLAAQTLPDVHVNTRIKGYDPETVMQFAEGALDPSIPADESGRTRRLRELQAEAEALPLRVDITTEEREAETDRLNTEIANLTALMEQVPSHAYDKGELQMGLHLAQEELAQTGVGFKPMTQPDLVANAKTLKQIRAQQKEIYKDVGLGDRDAVEETITLLQEELPFAGLTIGERMMEEALDGDTQAEAYGARAFEDLGLTSGERRDAMLKFGRSADRKATRTRGPKKEARKAGRKAGKAAREGTVQDEVTHLPTVELKGAEGKGASVGTAGEAVEGVATTDAPTGAKGLADMTLPAAAKATTPPTPPTRAEQYVMDNDPLREESTRKVKSLLELLPAWQQSGSTRNT